MDGFASALSGAERFLASDGWQRLLYSPALLEGLRGLDKVECDVPERALEEPLAPPPAGREEEAAPDPPPPTQEVSWDGWD